MKTEAWLQRVYAWLMQHGPAVFLAVVVLFLGLWLIRLFSVYLNRIMRRKQIDGSLKPFLQSVVIVALRVLLLAVMQIAGIIREPAVRYRNGIYERYRLRSGKAGDRAGH